MTEVLKFILKELKIKLKEKVETNYFTEVAHNTLYSTLNAYSTVKKEEG